LKGILNMETLLTFLGIAIVAGVVLGLVWRFAEDYFEKRSARQVEAMLQQTDTSDVAAGTPAPAPVATVSKSN
jgi:hypothetical protein